MSATLARKRLMRERFEIVYSDSSVIRGNTAKQFTAARQDGVLFVVIQYEDGSIIKHKGEDWYEFRGARIPGSWASDEVYNDIKGRLHLLTELLSCQTSTLRPSRR